ncbi:uncharacterized protein LOC132027439 isoform X2 [Mustela nigripes]|uniref:uncharacterized protein LOC132027439 isoform X2 n=1 Tax=Mustela nigripes TaxID=77151 RepID=UPI00281526F4|nr:uncharacterized protein LOC132027439 isoform X2 [Mustela nigripes]
MVCKKRKSKSARHVSGRIARRLHCPHVAQRERGPFRLLLGFVSRFYLTHEMAETAGENKVISHCGFDLYPAGPAGERHLKVGLGDLRKRERERQRAQEDYSISGAAEHRHRLARAPPATSTRVGPGAPGLSLPSRLRRGRGPGCAPPRSLPAAALGPRWGPRPCSASRGYSAGCFCAVPTGRFRAPESSTYLSRGARTAAPPHQLTFRLCPQTRDAALPAAPAWFLLHVEIQTRIPRSHADFGVFLTAWRAPTQLSVP